MSGFIDFKEVCRNVTIPHVLSCVSWKLTEKRKGQQWRGACPFCDDDKSFVFTENVKGSGIAKYFCHHCRKSGDAVTLVQSINGHSTMKDAAHELSGIADTGITEESDPVDSTVPEKSDEDVNPSLSTQLEVVSDRLQPSHKEVQALGISVETCGHFGAGYDPRGAFTRGCLAVPIHDPSGELVGFCGVPLKGNSNAIKLPKNFDPEKFIFNIHRIDLIGEIQMVEDVLGVLLSYENGIENAICKLTTVHENVVPFRRKESA